MVSKHTSATCLQDHSHLNAGHRCALCNVNIRPTVFSLILGGRQYQYSALARNNVDTKMLALILSREYVITVEDRGFSRSLLSIFTDDRVWFAWDKRHCKRNHCITRRSEKDPACTDQRPVRRKGVLRRSGMFSSVFTSPGVFYFGSDGLPLSTVCVVIVKQRHKEHCVSFTEEGFKPGK